MKLAAKIVALFFFIPFLVSLEVVIRGNTLPPTVFSC